MEAFFRPIRTEGKFYKYDSSVFASGTILRSARNKIHSGHEGLLACTYKEVSDKEKGHFSRPCNLFYGKLLITTNKPYKRQIMWR